MVNNKRKIICVIDNYVTAPQRYMLFEVRIDYVIYSRTVNPRSSPSRVLDMYILEHCKINCILSLNTILN